MSIEFMDMDPLYSAGHEKHLLQWKMAEIWPSIVLNENLIKLTRGNHSSFQPPLVYSGKHFLLVFYLPLWGIVPLLEKPTEKSSSEKEVMNDLISCWHSVLPLCGIALHLVTKWMKVDDYYLVDGRDVKNDAFLSSVKHKRRYFE